MSKEIRTLIRCDICKNDTTIRYATVADYHLCTVCLVRVHEEVHLEYMRLVKGQVPDRRGGWRGLGEYDG